jgi:hypothetical protein
MSELSEAIESMRRSISAWMCYSYQTQPPKKKYLLPKWLILYKKSGDRIRRYRISFREQPLRPGKEHRSQKS